MFPACRVAQTLVATAFEGKPHSLNTVISVIPPLSHGNHGMYSAQANTLTQTLNPDSSTKKDNSATLPSRHLNFPRVRPVKAGLLNYVLIDTHAGPGRTFALLRFPHKVNVSGLGL
jgi:hypothetical protein